MGAGNSPAGGAPMGFDPVVDGGVAVVKSATDAIYFDPSTRTFPLANDGSGLLQRVHWVDQSVTLCLAFKFGTIGSSPTTGSKYFQRKRIHPAQAETQAIDDALGALAGLLAAGHIEILNVYVTNPIAGREYVAVEYKNLREPSSTNTPSKTAQQPL